MIGQTWPQIGMILEFGVLPLILLCIVMHIGGLNWRCRETERQGGGESSLRVLEFCIAWIDFFDLLVIRHLM
jgi:hypothetical protein